MDRNMLRKACRGDAARTVGRGQEDFMSGGQPEFAFDNLPMPDEGILVARW